MKIIENNKMIDDEPYLTLEICCQPMAEKIMKDNKFYFSQWDIRLNNMNISYCPFCGKAIEYIEYGA